MIGPFDHPGITPEDGASFRHDPEPEEGEEIEVVCSTCSTKTLADFYDGERCANCDAQVEKSPCSLMERIQRAQARAEARWRETPKEDLDGRACASLDAWQARRWAAEMARIESGLAEMEKRT